MTIGHIVQMTNKEEGEKMKQTIFGTLRKIEFRCSVCGKWIEKGWCEDHPDVQARMYESYEIDDTVAGNYIKELKEEHS